MDVKRAVKTDRLKVELMAASMAAPTVDKSVLESVVALESN